MKRRHTAGPVPADLARFELEDWAAGGANDFEIYEGALHRWVAARDEWAATNGFEGDLSWWSESGVAILAMPDMPWNPYEI